MFRRNSNDADTNRTASRVAPRLGLFFGSALASIALAGCTASAPPAESSFAKAQAALADGKAEQAVMHAESAVLASPRSASYRALLGSAYLEAGRFQAAATSFGEALELGDDNPRTVLSQALALTAIGDKQAALSLLGAHEGAIAPADYGLALALAGKPERGIHVLVNEVRGGSSGGKVRQNLAYAYALAGNWQAARVMAAEDVPADQLDARIAEWAASAAPEAHRYRVASLLGVSSDGNGEMPAHLALANFPSQEMMVAEAEEMRADEVNADVAQAPVEVAPSETERMTFGIEQVDPTSSEPRVSAPIAAAPQGPQFVSNAVVQKVPKRVQKVAKAPEPVAKAPEPVAAKAPPRQSRIAIATGSAATHFVQLGSYDSHDVAQDKWAQMQKRFPALAKRDYVITKAAVDGRTFYRLAAAGFGRRSAQAMCDAVKSSGRGCFSYAASNPPAGAVKRNVQVAARSN
ncbi:MAG: SPOR domain-containing protein [Erythrobacter sp.]|uniref:SPOR domain-containing protein n=1 Tax=Erythrobacter sp. TaxID=1042 RepID=UPI003C7177FD